MDQNRATTLRLPLGINLDTGDEVGLPVGAGKAPPVAGDYGWAILSGKFGRGTFLGMLGALALSALFGAPPPAGEPRPARVIIVSNRGGVRSKLPGPIPRSGAPEGSGA